MRLLVAAVLFAIFFAPGAATAQGEGHAPSATDAPFTFTLPQSRVVLKISDTSLRPSAPVGNKPNYFKLERRDPLLIISGWLEPAAIYKGLDAFWRSEARSPAFAGPLAPIRVEMLHDSAWEIVAYDVPLPNDAVQSNLRAERVEAGTWVDLHLSTLARRPSVVLRAELLAALRKVQVLEKVVTRSP